MKSQMSKAKRVRAVVLVAAMVSVLGVQVSQAAPVRYISVGFDWDCEGNTRCGAIECIGF